MSYTKHRALWSFVLWFIKFKLKCPESEQNEVQNKIKEANIFPVYWISSNETKKEYKHIFLETLFRKYFSEIVT